MSDTRPAIDAQFVDEAQPKNGSMIRLHDVNEDLALTPIFDLATAKNRLEELQKFVKFYLAEGEDFGTIPGTPKPTLFKPGADKLCDIYGLADTYKITNRVEDWNKNLFDYEIECTILSKRTGHLVATGVGSCNSFEGRYRWRDLKRKCPKCDKPTIIKGKAEFTRGQEGFKDGGYVCWKKDGKSDGCGAKFRDDDEAITTQQVGRIENDDMPTLKNTILKMAKKRAKVDAVLSATRSSGLFTQDIEDWSVSPDEGGSQANADGAAKAKLDAAGVVPCLFYVHHAESDTYEITGPETLKTAQKDILKQFWSKTAGTLVCTGEQLEALKYTLEQRQVPFKLLRSATPEKSTLADQLKESIKQVAEKKKL